MVYELLAVRVEECSALSAHGLGDEEAAAAGRIKRGRVELDEMEVSHLRPRPEREREPAPGRPRRVRRMLVKRAESARRENHRVRRDGECFAVLHGVDSGAPPIGGRREFHRLHARKHGDELLFPNGGGEGELYFAPRRVAVVEDARDGMRPFSREMETLEPIGVPVERHSEFLDEEPSDEVRPFEGEGSGGVFIPASGGEDVGGEEFRRVVGSGVYDASLRVPRVRLGRVGELREERDRRTGSGG